MRRFLHLLAAGVALVPGWLLAASPAVEYQCPTRIMTEQKLVTPLPDWRASTERPFTTFDEKENSHSEHNLRIVSFSEGVPEERGWLEPDNESELTEKAWVGRWEFAKSENVWVTCEYRETTVMISKKLPPDIKRCFMRFDSTKGIQVQRVWCEK